MITLFLQGASRLLAESVKPGYTRSGDVMSARMRSREYRKRAEDLSQGDEDTAAPHREAVI